MYDLTIHRADRGDWKSARVSRVWRDGVIGRAVAAIGGRAARAACLWGVIAVACACPRPVSGPRPSGPEDPDPTEVWVDASAPAGGSGRADQPWRDLKSALAPRARIHLAPGIYPGPIRLPEGAALISRDGLGVISLEGPGAVITAGTGRLEGVSVQGGEVGLLVKGRLEVRGVRLSGQRTLGARVEAAGALIGERLEVVGVIPGIDGVQALPGARVALEGARFSGGLRRGIDASDAEVSLTAAASVGVKEQLHLEGGRAQVRQSTAASGSGPAYFVARGELDADGLVVQGHEYAVLSGSRAVVRLKNVEARSPQLAALGLVGSNVLVEKATLEGGAYAAIQLLECEGALREVQVHAAKAMGVVVRLSKVTLEKVAVHEVTADPDDGGDGIHLRGGEVTLRDVVVQRTAGAGVMATAGARVRIEGLGSEACRGGALVVELGSRVEARGVVVKDPGGPALVVPDRSTLSVSDLLLSGADVPVWAECAAGAEVSLQGIRGASPWRPPACVNLRAR